MHDLRNGERVFLLMGVEHPAPVDRKEASRA